MSAKPWTPLETVMETVNFELNSEDMKQELSGYQLSAQNLIEQICRRQFNGEDTTTQYKDVANQESLVLRNFPIRSVSLFREDGSRNFDDATYDIISSDYFTIEDHGLIWLKNGISFGAGNKIVKVIYKGGYITEKTVVPSATAADGILASDSLASYGQNFYAFVHTSGTGTAGSITLTGLDQDGAAQTEVLTPQADRVTAGKNTLSYSKKLWSSITQVDAVAILGSDIRITASSFPADLQMANRMLTAHLFYLDEDKSINTSSRSIGGRSETFDDSQIPNQILLMIQKYTSVIPS